MVYAAVGALLGILLGWLIRAWSIAVERRALEADWSERVKVVERGRNRQREAAEQAQGRLRSSKQENQRLERRVRKLHGDLRKARKAHAGCDGEIGGLQGRVAELEGQLAELERGHRAAVAAVRAERERALSELEREAESSQGEIVELRRRLDDRSAAAEQLRSELTATADAHAGCHDRIEALESRLEELEESRDRSMSEAKQLRFRRRKLKLQR